MILRRLVTLGVLSVHAVAVGSVLYRITPEWVSRSWGAGCAAGLALLLLWPILVRLGMVRGHDGPEPDAVSVDSGASGPDAEDCVPESCAG